MLRRKTVPFTNLMTRSLKDGKEDGILGDQHLAKDWGAQGALDTSPALLSLIREFIEHARLAIYTIDHWQIWVRSSRHLKQFSRKAPSAANLLIYCSLFALPSTSRVQYVFPCNSIVLLIHLPITGVNGPTGNHTSALESLTPSQRRTNTKYASPNYVFSNDLHFFLFIIIVAASSITFLDNAFGQGCAWARITIMYHKVFFFESDCKGGRRRCKGSGL